MVDVETRLMRKLKKVPCPGCQRPVKRLIKGLCMGCYRRTWYVQTSAQGTFVQVQSQPEEHAKFREAAKAAREAIYQDALKHPRKWLKKAVEAT